MEHLTFDEDNHIYKIDGIVFKSVTTFINTSLFEKFNEENISKKISQDKNKKYKEGDLYYNKTPEEIREIWHHNRDMGIRLHKLIDDHYKKVDNPDASLFNKEFKMFQRFKRKELLSKGLTFFKSEYRIYDKKLRMAGTIDIVYQKKDTNHVIIADWKRIHTLTKSNPFYSGNNGTPTKHTPNCNYNHYCIQLMLYKYLLENNYGLIVDEMLIVTLHPNQNDYIVEKVVYNAAFLKSIIEFRIHEVYIETSFIHEYCDCFIKSNQLIIDRISDCGSIKCRVNTLMEGLTSNLHYNAIIHYFFLTKFLWFGTSMYINQLPIELIQFIILKFIILNCLFCPCEIDDSLFNIHCDTPNCHKTFGIGRYGEHRCNACGKKACKKHFDGWLKYEFGTIYMMNCSQKCQNISIQELRGKKGLCLVF
jgi:hypothetical protein